MSSSTDNRLLKFAPNQMITLVSSDGVEIIVDKRCATISKTIKSMFTGDFMESKENRAEFQYDAVIMEKVAQFFYYKQRFDHSPDIRPKFDIPPEIALELMLAAHYLDI